MGREILAGLLADEHVGAVHALVRRPLDIRHAKLTQHRLDFSTLAQQAHIAGLSGLTEAYIALGTTIKVAGSQQAFRAVDFDAVLACARAAQAAGATRLGVVSAMGADARSRVFYNQVKGEAESALSGLGFATLVIARPSFLAGDREALGQPGRRGEALALKLSGSLAWLIPDNYKSIPARSVARALLRAVPALAGRHILASGAMRADGTAGA